VGGIKALLIKPETVYLPVVSPFVFFIVLCAALLNAGWNAMVKSGTDKQLDVALVSGAAGALGALLLPFLPQPAAASWPYLLVSTPVQLLYYRLLAAAYRRGDMSEAYPLMRGAAPLFVAMAAGPLIGEVLTVNRWVGVALICAGAFCMTADVHFRGRPNHSVVPVALVNALVIAVYTVMDGLGARKSGAPLAYALWVFVLTSIPLMTWTLLQRRAELLSYARTRFHFGLFGGASTVGSYGLTLFAMTAAPVALVAALRETSILFGTIIAVAILKERIRWPRYFAIALIATGAVVIRVT
jgi:drug/metabolite transporter (DMT)-like permease